MLSWSYWSDSEIWIKMHQWDDEMSKPKIPPTRWCYLVWLTWFKKKYPSCHHFWTFKFHRGHILPVWGHISIQLHPIVQQTTMLTCEVWTYDEKETDSDCISSLQKALTTSHLTQPYKSRFSFQMGNLVLPSQRLHPSVHHRAGPSRKTEWWVQKTRGQNDRPVHRPPGGSLRLDRGVIAAASVFWHLEIWNKWHHAFLWAASFRCLL